MKNNKINKRSLYKCKHCGEEISINKNGRLLDC